MDYMKFDSFMGRTFSKLLNKSIEAKTGVNPQLRIQDLNVKSASTPGTTSDDLIEVNLKVTMFKNDFEALIEEVTK